MWASFLKTAPQNLFHAAGFAPSVLFITFLYLLLRRARSSMRRLALLAFPGTFTHELLHFIVGTLLLAKPAGFSVWPKRADGGWLLGSVSFRKINLLNGAFVGLAPLLLLPLAWLSLTRLVLPFWVHHQWAGWTMAGYFTATLLFSALPSLQDFKVARPSLLLYGTLGAIGWLWGSSGGRAWFQ